MDIVKILGMVEGKFYVRKGSNVIYKIKGGILYFEHNKVWQKSGMLINCLENMEFVKIQKKITFEELLALHLPEKTTVKSCATNDTFRLLKGDHGLFFDRDIQGEKNPFPYMHELEGEWVVLDD